MPDKPAPKELEALLTRIMTKRAEPPDPPQSQSQDQERVIEADKILLRDGSGKSRGKISANADGSTGLILSDNEGSAWAWLGVNRDGEAFLELKDKKGEISFKVPGSTPASGTTAGSPGASLMDVNQNLAPEPLRSQSVSPQQALPDTAIPAPASGTDTAPSPSTVSTGWKPGYVDTTVYDRLEELERQNRGRGFFRAAILGLLVLVMATQAFLLLRPQSPNGPLEVESLMVRDQNGVLRAWLGEKDGNPTFNLRDRQGKLRVALGLDAAGSPALVLYDEGQRVRAGLHLLPNGDPGLDLRDKNSLMGKTEGHGHNVTDNQQSPAVSDPGDEDGTMAGPVASAAGDVSQVRDAAGGTFYVGSKTSNKYHIPSCKWAKTIIPSRLIKFKSVAEAQKRHYIPCPVCKPPPLSK